MTDEPQPPDLKDFSDRLRKARDEDFPPPGQDAAANSRGMGIAFRMATEMVAALLVGGGLGWFLDRWLKTSPWLLLAGLALGVASGMVNAFREAKRIGGG